MEIADETDPGPGTCALCHDDFYLKFTQASSEWDMNCADSLCRTFALDPKTYAPYFIKASRHYCNSCQQLTQDMDFTHRTIEKLGRALSSYKNTYELFLRQNALSEPLQLIANAVTVRQEGILDEDAHVPKWSPREHDRGMDFEVKVELHEDECAAKKVNADSLSPRVANDTNRNSCKIFHSGESTMLKREVASIGRTKIKRTKLGTSIAAQQDKEREIQSADCSFAAAKNVVLDRLISDRDVTNGTVDSTAVGQLTGNHGSRKRGCNNSPRIAMKLNRTERLQKMKNRLLNNIRDATSSQEITIPQPGALPMFFFVLPAITGVTGVKLETTFSGTNEEENGQANSLGLLAPNITEISDSLVQNSGTTLDEWRRDKKPRRPRYSCPITIEGCASKSFGTTESMERHIRSAHGGELKFFCDTNACATGFFTDVALQEHKTKYHNSTPTFLCDACPSAFSNNASLKAHMTIVHAEDPKRHVCEVCQKGYRLRTELQCHQYKMHRDLNPTKYTAEGLKCHFCDYISRTKNYLKVHVEIKHPNSEGTVRYRNYNCPKCEFRTHSASALKVHVKGVHSEAKSFKCHHCPNSYKSASCLASHLKVNHM